MTQRKSRKGVGATGSGAGKYICGATEAGYIMETRSQRRGEEEGSASQESLAGPHTFEGGLV